jgi:hypothetical protein
MAQNNDNNEAPTGTKDWLGLTREEMKDETPPLGIMRDKPLNYFDILTLNFVGNPNLFQVNLGHFPQNFLVLTGPGSKVRIVHSLFSANANPESTTSTGTVVGLFGTNKIAPFKVITATLAVLALTHPGEETTRRTPKLYSQASNNSERWQEQTSLQGWWGMLRRCQPITSRNSRTPTFSTPKYL